MSHLPGFDDYHHGLLSFASVSAIELIIHIVVEFLMGIMKADYADDEALF